jgi:ectoine hydroxylase-related dioxygenase (phytanoyl-CoA dioxygenase family)
MNAFAADPGFAVWPEALSERDVSLLLSALDESPNRSRAGVRHLMSNLRIAELATDPRLLALVHPVLGTNARPYRATLFDKSVASNWLVVWHQDTALPLHAQRDLPGWGPWSRKWGVIYAHAPARVLERILALRVHLDDSTPLNGPLRVLPGTNHMGVLTDAAIQKLIRELPAVECTVARGGIVSMRPLLVHASSKATTPAPRRVLHIEYAASLRLEHDLELCVA